MPHPWALADANFPSFRGDEHPREQVRLIVDYLMMLSEALRYQLENLDSSNWNQAAMKNFRQETVESAKQAVQEIEKALKNLSSRVDGIAVLMELVRVDQEGNVSLGQEGKRLNLTGNIYINGNLME